MNKRLEQRLIRALASLMDHHPTDTREDRMRLLIAESVLDDVEAYNRACNLDLAVAHGKAYDGGS